MAIILRQSTQIKVRVGPFVDVSDGFTPETGVALSTADEAELLKADGAATVDISSQLLPCFRERHHLQESETPLY